MKGITRRVKSYLKKIKWAEIIENDPEKAKASYEAIESSEV